MPDVRPAWQANTMRQHADSVMVSKAQTPLPRFLVDLSYNLFVDLLRICSGLVAQFQLLFLSGHKGHLHRSKIYIL